MLDRPGRRPVLAAAAALALLVGAVPCAARGTGGFLRDWAACGPLAETRLDAPALPDDFAAYPGLFAAGSVWLPVQADPDGRVNLRTLYPQPPTGTALLHTFFEVPADGAYVLRIGSDDAVRVELDGQAVHAQDVRRAWAADQDVVNVTLGRGWHRLLVRVVEYGGDWAASVRVADAKDQPLDVKHQAAVPEALERLCRLDEPSAVEEWSATAAHLAAQVAAFHHELDEALPRLVQTPEGYVTFSEYEGARDLGLRFFEALAALWQETVRPTWDAESARDAQRRAAGAARGFSEVLAQETERLGAALARAHRVWDTLGGEVLTRRDLAAATLQIGDLLARSRRLADRIENERLLAARFENDIRNFRQREFTLRVLDADGFPLDDAEVEVVQTDHEFPFGCNLFAFRRWGDDKRNALYEKRFRDLFNLAVVPLYWSAVERQRDRPDFGPSDAAVRWCRDHGLRVEVHPLVWDQTVPRWVEDLPAEEAHAAAQAYVRRAVERYRDTVDLWDCLQQPDAARVGQALLDPAEVLRWAAQARPRGRLLLAGDQAEALVAAARKVRAAGVPLDGLAASAHQHEGTWTLDLIRRHLDAAGSADLAVHVSGVTILGGPDGEAQQAEAVGHFYTAAFAHPRVASVTWWDLSDRFAWKNAPAGLVRADLSPKPAYRVLDRLINHVWRTDAAGRTGPAGEVRVRAFLGRHRITVQHGRRRATLEATLSRDGPAEVVVLLPPGR